MGKHKSLYLAFLGPLYKGCTFDKAEIIRRHPKGDQLQFVPAELAAESPAMVNQLILVRNFLEDFKDRPDLLARVVKYQDPIDALLSRAMPGSVFKRSEPQGPPNLSEHA